MKHNNIKSRFIGILMLMIFSGITGNISAQSDAEGTLQQYLFPDFSTSKVLLNNGTSQTAVMNYNMVTERMVYDQTGKKFDLINISTIDTVYIHDRKFVPQGNVFYELILKGDPLTLLIQQQASLQSAGTPAGYGGTSQVSATKRLSSIEVASGHYNLPLSKDYIVDVSPVYWIRKGGEMFEFYSEKQLLKILSDKEKELKSFIKENRIKISNTDQLARLINYYNSLAH